MLDDMRNIYIDGVGEFLWNRVLNSLKPSTTNPKARVVDANPGVSECSTLDRLTDPSTSTGLSKGPGACKSVYGFAHLKEHLRLDAIVPPRAMAGQTVAPVPGFYLSSSHHHYFIAMN